MQSRISISLALPDPLRTGAYRLEIISAYNLQSISGCAKRVWQRETTYLCINKAVATTLIKRTLSVIQTQIILIEQSLVDKKFKACRIIINGLS